MYRSICYCALTLFLLRTATAVVAAPGEITLTQPDGSTFAARLQGDEYANWHETLDGHTVIESNGTWYYADAAKGTTLTPSPYVVGAAPESAVAALPLHLRPADNSLDRVSRQLIPLTVNSDKSLVRTQKTLVILVGYNNQPFVYSDTSFADLFFGAANSVKHYYLESTYNNFVIAPAAESQGVSNDGVIHVDRNINHPNMKGATSNAHIEAAAVINLADAHVNFKSFDSNNNGILSPDELAVVIILAGYESAYGEYQPGVWGHQASMSPSLVRDTVSITPYAMFGELHRSGPFNLHQATIGIMCHEFGHLALGLPDLYDTDNSSSGIGIWGLMGSGSWNTVGGFPGDKPAHFCAWSKATLDIATPLDVMTASNRTVLDATSSPSMLRLWIDPYRVREYFLVENRQKTGYDAGLPGNGILIQHIDDSLGSNSDEDHPWVKVVEADGLSHLHNNKNVGDSGDLFPGSWNNQSFTNLSFPNSKDYSNANTGISITSIIGSGASISINVTPSAVGGTGNHVRYDGKPIEPGRAITVNSSNIIWSAVRYTNNTTHSQLDGFELFSDSTNADTVSVDFYLYQSMSGTNVPTTLIHSEAGFVVKPGWNRFILSSPQVFPRLSSRVIVLKTTSSAIASASYDRLGTWDGRSWLSASGGGPYTPLSPSTGFPYDLRQMALVSSAPAPAVSSITRSSSNPTGVSSVPFLVTFSESVTGVDTGDFALSTAGVTGASISSVTGSGTTRTVNVATGTGNGTIRLDLVDNDSIVDLSNTPLGDTGAGNGSFSSGESYSIYKSAPVLSASPLSAQIGPSAGTVLITLKNTGTGTLDWSAAVGSGSFITNISPSSGTLGAGASIGVTVTFSASASSCNATAGTVVISSVSGQGSPSTVSLTLLPNPAASAPASISYPTFTNSNTVFASWPAVSGACSYVVERSADGGTTWIVRSASAFFTGFGDTGVTNGSYRYRVRAGAQGSPWCTGTYDCVVQTYPEIHVGNPFILPTARAGTTTDTVKNTGGAPLTYSVRPNVSWLSATAVSSNLFPGQTSNVTVSYTQNTSYYARIGHVAIVSPNALQNPSYIIVYQPGVSFFLNNSHGPESGGTPVTINGSGFDNGLSGVYFGANAASIQSSTAMTINVLTPPGTGNVAVRVVTADGPETLSSAFQYDALPSVPFSGLLAAVALAITGAIAVRRGRR